MKLFRILVPTLMLMLASVATPAGAQKFVGYDLSKDQASLRAACKATQGAWTTYYWMGDNSQITNGATCVYKKQLVSDNEDTDLIRPAQVKFIFDKHNAMVETAEFLWRFPAWARREDVRNHFIVKLQDLGRTYPYDAAVTKVGPGSYRLQSTPFYLRLLVEDEEEIEVPEYLLYVYFVRGTP